jgi:hypothetical protein
VKGGRRVEREQPVEAGVAPAGLGSVDQDGGRGAQEPQTLGLVPLNHGWLRGVHRGWILGAAARQQGPVSLKVNGRRLTVVRFEFR